MHAAWPTSVLLPDGGAHEFKGSLASGTLGCRKTPDGGNGSNDCCCAGRGPSQEAGRRGLLAVRLAIYQLVIRAPAPAASRHTALGTRTGIALRPCLAALRRHHAGYALVFVANPTIPPAPGWSRTRCARSSAPSPRTPWWCWMKPIWNTRPAAAWATASPGARNFRS